jgi:choline dehydrogenase-like flavoprotein
MPPVTAAVAKAIVVGSGAGGSTAAMVLAQRGWDVVMLEKGSNYLGDLRDPTPATKFSNDEVKSSLRFFEEPDYELAEPRTYRRSPTDAEPLVTGMVNHLPSTVGGGTVHWDAKTPRFWDIDFKKRSLLGPSPGADVQDWPFTYADLAPYYDEVEALIGVQGDIHQLPELTRRHAPHGRQFVMPPGPPAYVERLIAAGARTLGLHAFPAPSAINSVAYRGRPACNNCGQCGGYGCPIHARVGALAPLREAVRTGRVDVRADTMAYRVERQGRRVTGVSFYDPTGRSHTESADAVVLAGSSIETVRLALLSRLPDPHGLIGRRSMFHWFTEAIGVFLDERLHAYRSRGPTGRIDDFTDPDFPGARAAAAAAGLPYIRGGVLELGGSQDPIGEGMSYQTVLSLVSPEKPFGRPFKELMRASILRDRLAAIEMIAEDLPQPTNAVDLDPKVRDAYGLPVARVTYSPHQHEIVAQRFYMPLLISLLKASGATAAAAVPRVSTPDFPVAAGDAVSGFHLMGGMWMGRDARTSVTDAHGRFHGLDNLFASDGSVFVTAGSHNPTLTIMSVALRNTRHWA